MLSLKRLQSHFNPRSREGSDQVPAMELPERGIFQSSLPRGERRLSLMRLWLHLLFQSSLPRGERQKYGRTPATLDAISILAPARGATSAGDCGQHDHYRFQSSLPRGERLVLLSLKRLQSHFNPRSREGSDCIHPAGGARIKDFNPRSREGSDPFFF